MKKVTVKVSVTRTYHINIQNLDDTVVHAFAAAQLVNEISHAPQIIDSEIIKEEES